VREKKRHFATHDQRISLIIKGLWLVGDVFLGPFPMKDSIGISAKKKDSIEKKWPVNTWHQHDWDFYVLIPTFETPIPVFSLYFFSFPPFCQYIHTLFCIFFPFLCFQFLYFKQALNESRFYMSWYKTEFHEQHRPLAKHWQFDIFQQLESNGQDLK